MKSIFYPANMTEFAPGDFVVRFRDVPEVVTGGDNPQAALAGAPDALACAIEGYLKRGWAVPAPSAALDGESLIALDPSLAAQVVKQQ